jgi:hypothetical protein
MGRPLTRLLSACSCVTARLLSGRRGSRAVENMGKRYIFSLLCRKHMLVLTLRSFNKISLQVIV